MYERDLLREEFDRVLRDKRKSAQMLAEMLSRVEDPALRSHISDMHAHARRDVELGERLVEIVS